MRPLGKKIAAGIVAVVLCVSTVLLITLAMPTSISAEEPSTYIKNTVSEKALCPISPAANLTTSVELSALISDEESGISYSENEDVYYVKTATGMINLAKFTNGHDTDGLNFVLMVNDSTLTLANDFPGLGSEAHPFKGSLQSFYTLTINLSGSGALFRYLSSSAEIFCSDGTGNVTLAANESSGALAQVLVTDSASFALPGKLFLSGSVLNGYRRSEKMSDSGAIAGRIEKPSDAAAGTLDFTLDLTTVVAGQIAMTSIASDNSGDAGHLVGTVVGDIALTINIDSGITLAGVSVSSRMGNAGGIVGSVSDGASVNITGSGITSLDLSGVNVSATCGNAGGLVGELDSGTFSSTLPVDLTDIKVESYVGNGNGGNAGGVIGKASDTSGLDLRDVGVSGTIGAGRTAGGFAGHLIDPTLTFDTDTYPVVDDTVVRSDGICAGVVGIYEGEDLSLGFNEETTGSFSVGNVTLVPVKGSATAAGGFIGLLSASGDGEVTLGAVSGDVLITVDTGSATGVASLDVGGIIGRYENSSIANTLTLSGAGTTSNAVRVQCSSGNARTFGGVVGFVNVGSYLDADALSVYVDSVITSEKGAYGDIIGKIAGKTSDDEVAAIVRLGSIKCTAPSGASASLISSTGKGSVLSLYGTLDVSTLKYLHTVEKQDRSLIYADAGCTIVRNEANIIGDDIGNYGQIINNNILGVITLDDTTHEVSIHSLTVSGNTVTIEDATDLAAVSIHVQTEGIFGYAGYASLYASGTTYNFGSSDIDLRNAGIESIIPVNDLTRVFSATVNGNSRTLYVNIGAHYKNDTTYINNDGIFTHVTHSDYTGGTAKNYETYLAFFTRADSAVFSSLTVDGTIKINRNCDDYTRYHVGGFVAKTNDTGTSLTSFDSCTSKITIDCSGEPSIAHDDIRHSIGGFIGSANTTANAGKTLVLRNCTSEANITLNRLGKKNLSYAGGFIGIAFERSKGNNIDLTGSTSDAVISYSHPQRNSAGALIASISNSETTGYNRVGVTLHNVTMNSARVTLTGNRDTADDVYGGLFGTYWYSVDVDISVLSVGEHCLVEATNYSTNFGAMIHTAIGKITVDGSTTDIKGSYAGLSTSGSNSLFVYDGTLLYFVVRDADVFAKTIASNLTGGSLSITGGAYRDLLVGKNITSYADGSAQRIPERGGIVTLESSGTDVTPGSFVPYVAADTAGYMWYQKTAKNFYNPQTRYFCNVESLIALGSAPSTISCPDDLIRWSVFAYASRTNTRDGLTEFYGKNVPSTITLSADIDLSGLCYYPVTVGYATNEEVKHVTVSSLTLNMNGHTIKFDEPDSPINTAVSDPTHQMRMAQTGLFANVNTSIKVSDGSFTGTVLPHSGGSGFLVTGNLGRTYSPEDRENVDVTLEKITLSGIRVKNCTDATPLMINRVTECVDATLSEIILNKDHSTAVTAASLNYGDYSVKAGSSLIGTVGSDTAHQLYFTFSRIELDEYSSGQLSPFTKATLISYLDYTTGSGGFTYNFNIVEDWESSALIHKVTYGKELYVKGTIYYDQPTIYVSPVSDSASSVYAGFSAYLPYVVIPDTGSDAVLNINVILGNLITGWGTYEHPYQITKISQFSAIWSMINIKTASPGWQVRYPVSTSAPLASYTYTFDGTSLLFSSTDAGASDKTLDEVREWLRCAYYVINVNEASGDLEYSLSADMFSTYNGGLGVEDDPFCGVLIGVTPEITFRMPVLSGTTDNLGLVGCAGGCVIKNLTILFPSEDYRLNSKETNAFGGVIDRVLGGDNLIENVKVAGIDEYLSFTSKYIFVGGYVGVVKTGGVIFRNIPVTASPGITRTVTAKGSSYYYVNPYIGRVLDGYACSDAGTTPVNTDKNYKIVTVTSSENKVMFTGTAYTVPDAQTLWAFSAAVNSGALSYGHTGSGYADNLRSRYAKYDGIVDHTARTDNIDTSTGKLSDDTSSNVLYPLSYFGSSAANDVLDGSTYISVTLDGASYDMSSYGNGFRGIGARYDTAAAKLLHISDISGTVSGAKATVVKLDMNVRQYGRVELRISDNGQNPQEASLTTEGEGYYALAVGFINSLRNIENTTTAPFTVSDLTVSGNIRYTLDNKAITYSGVTSSNVGGIGGSSGRAEKHSTLIVGGVIGYAEAAATFTNVSAYALNAESPETAGGIIGIAAGGATFDGCGYSDIYVIASSKLGGFCGGTYKGITVTGASSLKNGEMFLRIGPSDVDLAEKTYLSMYEGAGGIVGVVEGGKITIGSVSDTITLDKVAVYYIQYAKIYKNGRAGIGGLVGSAYLPEKTTTSVVQNVSMTDMFVATGPSYPLENIDSAALPQISTAFGLSHYISDETVRGYAARTISTLFNNTPSSLQYGIAGAGGAIGFFGANGDTSAVSSQSLALTFDGVSLNSDSRPVIVFSSNAAGGILGDSRSKGTITFENCSVNTIAKNNTFLILGETRSAGLIGYNVASNSSTTVANNCDIGNSSYPTFIFTISTAHQSMAGGAVSDVYVLNMNNVNVTRAVIVAHLSGGIVTRIGNQSGFSGTVNIVSSSVKDCWIYGCKGSGGTSTSSYNYSAAGGIIGQIQGTTSSLKLYLKNCEVSECLIEAEANASYAYLHAGGIIGIVRNKCEIYGQWINSAHNNVTCGSATFTPGESSAKASDLSFYRVLCATGIVSVPGAAVDNGFASDTLNVNEQKCGVVIGYLHKGQGSTVQILGMHREDDPELTLPVNQIAAQTDNTAKFETNDPDGCLCSVVYTDFGYDSSVDGATLNDLKTHPSVVLPTTVTASPTLTLKGDGIKDSKTDMLGTKWWYEPENKDFITSAMTNYSAILDDEDAVAIDLPIFNLSGTLNSKINVVLTDYINFLTNGGYETWSKTKTATILTIKIKGYTVGEDGKLTERKNGSNPIASLTYNASTGFAFSGTYDEIKNGTFTVVTVEFKATTGTTTTETYSMDIPIYYKQVLAYESTLIVLEKEHYYLPDYLISTSDDISVDNASTISVYIEYIYNEVRFDFNEEFAKVLSCSLPLKSGTKLTLIDLNSSSASDFKAYYHTLSDAEIPASGEMGIALSIFSTPATPLNSLPSDLAVNNTGAVTEQSGIERYLLIIELTGENLTDSDAEIVTMRATADPDQGIPLITEEKNAKVKVFKNIGIELEGSTAQSFISTSDTRRADVALTPSIVYPVGYVEAMKKSIDCYYGTLNITLKNASGSSVVSLPAGTVITVTDSEYNVIQSYELTTPQHDFSYLLTGSDGVTPLNLLTERPADILGTYHILLDFSEVDPGEFSNTFESNTNYLFETRFSVSTRIGAATNNNYASDYEILTTETISKIKISVNKTCDSLYFGVNPNDDGDRTNSGKITFEVYSVISGFDPGSESLRREVVLRFVLKKKVTNADLSITYEETSPNGFLTSLKYVDGNTELISGNSFIETVIEVDESGSDVFNGNFELQIDPSISYYANYMIEAQIMIKETPAGGDAEYGTPAADHLIYTVAKMNNILAKQ